MILTRAPSRAPFTVAVKITSGPQTPLSCASRPPASTRRVRRAARGPAVGQEAVSSRSRRRRLVRSQWFPPRHGSPSLSLRVGSCTARTTDKRRLWLKTAFCLSAKGVATTKQRFDRAAGPRAAPCARTRPQTRRLFSKLKSHPVRIMQPKPY